MSKGAKSKSHPKRPPIGLPHYLSGGQVASGAKGALAGAGTGAAIGSVVPGIGTAIGAVAGGLIGGISGLFGGGSSDQAQLTQTVSGDQLSNAYNNSQSALGQQQDLTNQLAAQGGISNQSSVYNQEQGLANQLSAMAQGSGPNPALAQLNQTTGQNVANQAALMAGQRGAGTNAALIARQAAQQGAATQQQAVGQAATLRANQQLSAISALQNQQSLMGNLSTTQVAQQQNATAALNQLSQAEQSQLLNAAAQYNNAQIANNGQQVQQSQYQQSQATNILGGVVGGVGSLLSSGVLGSGSTGSTGSTSAGGNYSIMPSQAASNTASTGNMFGVQTKFADGGQVGGAQQGMAAILKENYKKGPKSKIAQYFANGGKVEAMVSPGEIYLSPDKVAKVAKGKASPLDGEKIPGKAKVAGARNSYANDTVAKTLKEGGIVLPRSVTQSEDKKEKAKRFVEHVLSKKGKR